MYCTKHVLVISQFEVGENHALMHDHGSPTWSTFSTLTISEPNDEQWRYRMEHRELRRADDNKTVRT